MGTPPAGALALDAAAPLDRQVLDGVLSALSLLVDNLRLQEQLRGQLHEVQASRARLVEAADAERKRVERDLHDGAQQYLIASALSVRRAREHLHEEPARADEQLAQAEEQLSAAAREIGAIARGLHPMILEEEGVGAAVDSLCQRLPLQVALADETQRRYPRAIEAAAYFVIAEALVNVVKHAGTASAAVGLQEGEEELLVDVVDSGHGGADMAGGSGLRGLSDRVAACGGALSVTTAGGGGTHVHARLPETAPPLEGVDGCRT